MGVPMAAYRQQLRSTTLLCIHKSIDFVLGWFTPQPPTCVYTSLDKSENPRNPPKSPFLRGTLTRS